MCHGKVYSEQMMERMPIMQEYAYKIVAEGKTAEDIAEEENVSVEFVKEICMDIITINTCMEDKLKTVL